MKRASLRSSLSSLIPTGTTSFYFVYSPHQRTLLWHSDNSFEVLGIRPAMLTGAGNFLLHSVHSCDRFRLLSSVDQAISGKCPLNIVYKWNKDGEIVSLYTRAEIVRNRKIDLLVGSICDVTTLAPGLHLNELPLGDLLTSPEQGLLILDAELRITLISSTCKGLSFKFGDPYFNSDKLIQGASFPDLFSSPESHSFIESAINRSRDAPLLPVTFSFSDSGVSCLCEVVSIISDSGVIATRISAIRQDLRTPALPNRSSPNNFEIEIHQAAKRQMEHLISNSFTSATLLADLKGLSPAIGPIVDGLLNTLDRALLVCSALNAKINLNEIDINDLLILSLERIAQIAPQKRDYTVTLAPEPPMVLVTDETLKVVCAIIAELFSIDPISPISISTVSSKPNSESKSVIRVELVNVATSSLSHLVSLREDFSAQLAVCGLQCQISSRQEIIRCDLLFSQSHERGIPPSSISKTKAIVIDDDEIVGNTLRQLFLEVGQEAIFCRSATIAIPIVQNDPDAVGLILVDALMDDISGEEAIRELRSLGFAGRIYGITGSPSEEPKLLAAGADAVLLKPIDLSAIRELVVERPTGVATKERLKTSTA